MLNHAEILTLETFYQKISFIIDYTAIELSLHTVQPLTLFSIGVCSSNLSENALCSRFYSFCQKVLKMYKNIHFYVKNN